MGQPERKRRWLWGLAALPVVLTLAALGYAAWGLYNPVTRMPPADSLPFTLGPAERQALLDLYSPDPEKRILAAYHVSEIAENDPAMAARLVPFMIGLLGDCDSPARPRPAFSVAYVKSLWTPPHLAPFHCDFICNRDRRPDIAAAKVLTSIGKPAVGPLLKVLRESKRPVARHYAARALGYIDDPRAQEAVMAALKDPAWEVRAGAIDGIADGLLCQDKTPYSVRAEAVAGILAAAHDKFPVVREAAAWALIEEEGPGVRDALLALLHDRDPIVRKAALEVTGPRGWAAGEMVKALWDPDRAVREEAATLIKQDPMAVPTEALRSALKDADPFVREAAAAALETLGAPK